MVPGMAQTTLYLTICVANVMLFGSLLNVNIIIASKVSFSVYVCSDHRLSQPCVVWWVAKKVSFKLTYILLAQK